MVETGIPSWMKFLGRIRKVRVLFLLCQPGVEGEIFGLQTVYGTLKKGGTCVFVYQALYLILLKANLKSWLGY